MHDVFLAWFDLSRNRLLNGTYLGGENIEYNSYLMPRLENGSVYVVGATASFTFPTTEGCYHTRLDGESDGFVAAIRFEETPWELPTAPLNLSAAPQDGGAILRWEPPTFDSGWPIDRYRVFAGSIPGEEVFLKDVSDDEGCLVTGLVNGREYSFRVTAVTIVGEGPSSDSVQVMPIRHPGPPVAFEAEAGMGSATLRWSPPTDTGFSPVLGFHLFRGTEPSSLGLISVLGNVTGFLDEGLDPGRLYYYQVRAFNLAGNGTMSNLVQVVPLGLPTEPLLLKAVPGDGEVRLTWRPPLNDGGSLVLGYRLLKAVTGGDLWEYEVLGAVTECTDAQVINGISYDFALVAFTAVGDGPLSKVVTARPEGAPGIPLNFTAMGSDGKVTLSWDAPLTDGGAAIIGYHILRGEDGGELRLHNEIGPLTSCIDENVLNGVRYAYQVCAVNSHGEGPRTPLTSCVPLGLPGPPTWITGHAIDGTAELSWSPPESDGGSPVLGYKLYQGGSPDVENLIAELPTADTGHEVAGLTNGVTYRYWISAFTAVGEGPAGGPVLMVPLGPPGPPRDLTATRGDSKVTLEWRTPADDGGSAVTGYVLCREDSSGAMRVIATLGPVLSHVDVGLFNGRTYNYSVAAVNAVGNGTQAGIVAAVPAGLPGMPLGVTASVKGSTVSLRWDAPESDGGSLVLRFLVLRGSSPDDLSPLGNVTGCFTYEDAGVERGRTYFYAVVAVNDVGQGPISLVEVDVRKGEKSPGVTAFATGLALAIVHCAHRASRRPMPSRQGPRV